MLIPRGKSPLPEKILLRGEEEAEQEVKVEKEEEKKRKKKK